MPTDHGSGYEYLFADPATMRDPLAGSVPHERVTDAGFATLGRVNGSCVSHGLHRRGHKHRLGSVFSESRIQRGKCFAFVYTFVYTERCK